MVRRQVAGVTGIGQRKLGTHHDRVRETTEQRHERDNDIHDTNALVVDRGQPFTPQVAPFTVIGDETDNGQASNGRTDERPNKDRHIIRNGRQS